MPPSCSLQGDAGDCGASMDVLAMRLKDSEKLPMDDYTNIDRAYMSEIIDERINPHDSSGHP